MLTDYFCEYEPDLIRERKARRLKRKRFWSAGVNDIWCVDQHDKWKRFGLYLHIGTEPYSGYILWLRIWKGNSDAGLVASYFLDTAEKLGCEFHNINQQAETYNYHSHPTHNSE